MSALLHKILARSVFNAVNFKCYSISNFNRTLLKVKKCTDNTPKRNKFFFSFKKPNAEKLKIEDNVPSEYNLIYRNTMYRYLIVGQIMSGVGVVTIAYEMLKSDFNKPMHWKTEEYAVKDEYIVYLSAFIFITAALNAVLYKSPIRIYHLSQQKKYIFMFYRSIPFLTRRLTCDSKQISKIRDKGFLPWNDSKYEIENKQQIIMIENFFRRPADLSIMLGEMEEV